MNKKVLKIYESPVMEVVDFEEDSDLLAVSPGQTSAEGITVEPGESEIEP